MRPTAVIGDQSEPHEKTMRLLVNLTAVFDRDNSLLHEQRYGEGFFLGMCVDAVPAALGAAEVRETVIIQGMDKPKVTGRQPGKYARRLSYGVEIWVKQGNAYKPRTPRDEGGWVHVAREQGDVFAVRLVNKADHEVAATLTLDGLHALRFSEIEDRKTQRPALVPFLVPARQSVLIRGWPINLSKSDEFLVTSYAKSAAKELNSDPGKIGVIGVQFAAAWKVGANRPADEPKGKAGENIGLLSRHEPRPSSRGT